MKRAFSFFSSPFVLVAAGTGLIAATYGLVRLAYGLLLVDVQNDLGLSVAAAGMVSGGASVVYCVGALIGLLAAGRHPRALVVAAGLSAAVGAIGMAAAQDAGLFAVFAIAGSAGAGLASPALVAVLQRNPGTQQPRAQAIVNAGTGPGLVAAGILALVLLPDWRMAWTIAAVFTVAVAALVLALDRGASDASPSRALLPPASWFGTHAHLIAAAALMGFGSAAVWNFGRTFLVDAGATDVVSVAAWIAIGLGGTAVIVTASWVERLGPGTTWIVTVCTMAVATAALIIAPANAPLALAACAAFGWGYIAGSGVLIAWTARLDAPRAPAGTALLFVTLILGQAVGAAVIGGLIPGAGYTVAFLTAAAATLVAAAAPAVRRGTAEGGTKPALSEGL